VTEGRHRRLLGLGASDIDHQEPHPSVTPRSNQTSKSSAAMTAAECYTWTVFRHLLFAFEESQR